jgi:hypothetical protein
LPWFALFQAYVMGVTGNPKQPQSPTQASTGPPSTHAGYMNCFQGSLDALNPLCFIIV